MDALIGMIIGVILCALMWLVTPVRSYEYEHLAAEAACHKNGGYSEIRREGRYTFICKDGARFDVESIEDNRK